jgi:hypothetical protein
LHIANKLAHTAAENGHTSIAQLASAVFDLASGGAPWRRVGHEASRLLVEAEGVLHAANGPAEGMRKMGRSRLRR